MEYRYIPGTDEKISVIGLGSYYCRENDVEIERVIHKAMESGINYYDTVVTEDRVLKAYRYGFDGFRRNDYKLQIHIGADYTQGKYGWTRDLDTIKRNFEQQMVYFEYADVALIHCIDKEEDYDNVIHNGIWDYLLKLQEEKRVRYIGCSTHNPDILRRFVRTGKVQIAMFSINMVYDYLNLGQYAIGTINERYKIYKECETAGVALTVMKPYAGKRLLHASLNSFHKAFSTTQCLQYVLDRPAVICALPGITDTTQLDETLYFLNASDEEKDYSELYELSTGNGIQVEECVYCNHCQPCPVGIDIGLVNKYYDLAVAGDRLATEHYKNMSVKAEQCIRCGRCERMCPFQVKQMDRMKIINEYFQSVRKC